MAVVAARGWAWFVHVFVHGLSRRQQVVLSQVPLAAAIALVAVVVAVWRPDVAAEPLFVWGLLGQAILLALAWAVPWGSLPPGAALAVPLLDFVPIGLVRVAGLGTEMQLGALAVVPVVWLAWSGLRPGFCMAAAFLGPLLMVWLPLAVAGSADAGAYAQVLVLPAMMLAAGAVVHLLAAATRDQRRSLEDARAQLQEALEAKAREKRLLDTVLETIPVGVQALDASGATAVANRQQYLNKALAGRVPGVGQDWPRVFDMSGAPLPPDRQPVVRAVRGEAFSDFLVRLGEGPTQRVFSTSARPVQGPDGRPDGAVLAFSDVTSLMEALAAKDVFLANVSHELRNPLTSMTGYLDLLGEIPGMPSRAGHALEVVRRNTRRLERLVGDLLAAASGAIDVRPEPADVAELVRLAVEAAAPAARSAGVGLKDGTVCAQLPAVVDPVRIAQLLDNLLSNAIKYTRPGGRVVVRASRAAGGIVCEVCDTGIGMSAEEAAAVFTRFYRAPGARAARVPGLGLGLPIARSIVEGHGGRIECSSRPGAGTTFTVFLPDPAAEPGEGPGRGAETPAGHGQQQHLGPQQR
ncbi:Histidine kinase [Sinomonas atrocyanea]|uniref:histidine kinase n=1 Tax=Sinomonas atrocyanea TaxID=37927 RepID=A0A126ZYD9_9MICC|nr:Histidine kinase [Sinomonas atrocyanea]GEB64259.1 two-component sensor histidine kinase [Sinomonas atrocyanea]GGG57684.1 two-component sensor histidine kinase [Sinomonas atrocyanea]